MILHEYYNLLPVAANRKAAMEWAKSRPRPAYICGRAIDGDELNLLSFRDYIRLAGAKDDNTFLLIVQEVLGINGLRNEDAGRALGLLNWVARFIAKITELFNKASIPSTAEEKQAGVENLRFGIFGIVDWFAKRMRITHESAERTGWQTIYKCLDMDVKTAIYERKLQQQYIEKAKAKSKKK